MESLLRTPYLAPSNETEFAQSKVFRVDALKRPKKIVLDSHSFYMAVRSQTVT